MRIKTPAILACALGATLVLPAAAEPKPSKHPPHVIPHSELRVLPPDEFGRHYQLHIGLPSSYHEQKEKRYPVVFVTDAYWDFQKITSIHGGLVYDKVVPEFITVGLGYAGENLDYGRMRQWELAPVPWGNPNESGHARDFLQTIEKRIIPFVEQEYRVNGEQRVLAGASLGGLFTLYAMYTRPELFMGYVAATPAVVLGNDWLLQYEDTFARSGRALPARLYVTGGGFETPAFLGGIERFHERLQTRQYPEFHYQYRTIEEERHAGMQFESYVRGLRYVFEPLAPESGPAQSM